ncbi:MAG: outer membrane beta-barrel protein [Bacteriovorax sp.]|nr:outer membrane beta-barrel protein [Bacteriovorax sp.]
MNKNILALFILSTLAVTKVEASGLFVEPMVTYETGSGDINFPAPINSSDSKVKGFGVGARAGGQVWNMIFAGIDGRYSIPKLKDTSLNQDIKSKAWNAGPMVGLQMPTALGLRFWGSWILAGELDPDKDKGVDEKFKSGNGFRLGGGLRVALVSLNVEYQHLKYDETEIQEAGVFTPGYTTNNIVLKNNTFIMSVSIPINL